MAEHFKPTKVRLDVLIHNRGLATSRESARRLIMAGQVLVAGQVVAKPGQLVYDSANVQLKLRPRYVSRGGDKLVAALHEFAISPSHLTCADVGASTGGFTDCLLQAGARIVYAMDVGYGQLAWSLREDARVVVMERVNARYLQKLPEKIDLACIDVSFISLRLLLPVVHGWLRASGQIVALIKPQFEAGRERVGKGGVVRNPDVHAEVLQTIIQFSINEHLSVGGLMPSPIKGPSGNVEFLLWLAAQEPVESIDIHLLIERALQRAADLTSDKK